MLETVTWQAGGRHLEWREETGDEINEWSFHASRGLIVKQTKRELPKEKINKWKENNNDQ